MFSEVKILLYNATNRIYDSLAENIILKGGNYSPGHPFLGGIRNPDNINNFNDIMFLLYHDDLNQPRVHIFWGTTDPGLYYTENPMNNEGAAILALGVYNDIWRLGVRSSFKKFYKNGIVLRQDGSQVDINYDATKNGKIESFEKPNRGNFEIQYHLMNLDNLVHMVGRWSAGCQGPALFKDYDFLIKTLQQYDKKTGRRNRFSYFLSGIDDLLLPIDKLIERIAA